ncbi:TolC family outer membrane protein [Bradyrhizobium sp. AUGA SZCCT0240]|uniref:TolC family outer membrane protein n=1 Tax=unclassified Bradyrhizobium TaxID=2631580 RepID=UPI001BAD0240|nr:MULTISPECIES: TolC family outer membrane protein [unclassified Bradyrhizobium]MBR1188871.1 TolC family outer membrane protein [Bradyrhizobium sp. AUGA SZCCT0160]MBR1201077.1 TolC family outer membrane protein [Bradyrhizobium sp. AUGA SZCCT0158]MBR1245209.1 TolC family outer membrane protein [Bradyrhizobium sp. AUGA SZCCT0274]MBR1250026.1 TolC family outer membrane protein [Bradyrhizobium sp. AUGA SZCCT0169]MBR1258901.1 TolC family outer membrane protein [Bradyrhizobium sp. AUGA SZCCT0240]
MRGVKVFAGAAASVLLLTLMGPTPALADTIEAALVRAYQNNPQLNAQRAQVRFTDEAVPQALSGYRPRVAVTASAGYQYTDTRLTSGGTPDVIVRTGVHGTNAPRSVGATITQNVFNGQQTANRTRAAESQVSGAREALRALEQTVLLSAATIYMDYLRDSAIVEVQKSNVRVLEQTLKQTKDRFNVGEVTRTDVAQSEAQLAAGRTQQLTAESNLNTTRSNFRRIIGNEPVALAPGSPVDRFLPGTLPGAVELGLTQNPNVTAAMYGIDVSYMQVKVNEGALLPTVNLVASVQQAYEQQMTVFSTFGASAVAQLNVPIYNGGAEYSLIRQSKETLAQQRLTLEQQRDQARANVVTAWGQLVAGKAQVQSAQAQVTASEIALNGVREEAKAGQRTTLDVLNAQQALVNARVALVTAQHDRVVASYSVLNTIGRLSPIVLKLPTTTYDPSVHYHQVRDSWAGVRTPDGR